MAKDGLKQKAAEIAVPAEEMGLELAKEMSSNIEKWLSDSPDRQKWTQEDPLTKTDTPMPECPPSWKTWWVSCWSSRKIVRTRWRT